MQAGSSAGDGRNERNLLTLVHDAVEPRVGLVHGEEWPGRKSLRTGERTNRGEQLADRRLVRQLHVERRSAECIGIGGEEK
jgi:hypothetical protein